jgi:HK97 family phage prohead protease
MLDRLEAAFELKSLDVAQRIIEGYASTPDLDQGDDIVEPGACKFSDPSNVQVYVGHDHRLGALPIGVPLEIRHDGRGLFTKTRIHHTARGDELLAVASERSAIGKPLGISIGYPTSSVVAKYERKSTRLIRHIQSLDLAEYSFTAMPLNEHAVVTAVKDRTDLSSTEIAAEMDSWLMEIYARDTEEIADWLQRLR